MGTIAGIPFSFPSGTPPVDDVVVAIPGLSVVLNMQTPDTKEAEGITTDAIAIGFTDFPIGPNVVSGTIVLGQSEASLSVIPEPATWVEMLAGFGAVGLLMARARTRSKATAETSLPA
jgi:hypothetical protein